LRSFHQQQVVIPALNTSVLREIDDGWCFQSQTPYTGDKLQEIFESLALHAPLASRARAVLSMLPAALSFGHVNVRACLMQAKHCKKEHAFLVSLPGSQAALYCLVLDMS
jgi:hypothetical protein